MEEIGRHAQGARPARGVQRLHAAGCKEGVIGTEEEVADGAQVGRVADDRLVELGRLRVEDALLGLGHRVEHRRDAALIDVDARGQADLARARVCFEGLGQAEDAVGWCRLEVREGARHARIVARRTTRHVSGHTTRR